MPGQGKASELGTVHYDLPPETRVKFNAWREMRRPFVGGASTRLTVCASFPMLLGREATGS